MPTLFNFQDVGSHSSFDIMQIGNKIQLSPNGIFFEIREHDFFKEVFRDTAVHFSYLEKIRIPHGDLIVDQNIFIGSRKREYFFVERLFYCKQNNCFHTKICPSFRTSSKSQYSILNRREESEGYWLVNRDCYKIQEIIESIEYRDQFYDHIYENFDQIDQSVSQRRFYDRQV